ncbi:hypothetical protein FXN61_39365 [Lentzea sp. PSKA42]|uniref:Uncharacterized protein n=1 Tax=Lentzea indica TaxID=2604800 RepID=A0ABX1FTY5_9PSEU|nr:hypothetical protein [Lentzea indica]NKE62474.1 hypothetical protein [Lentzea indica]
MELHPGGKRWVVSSGPGDTFALYVRDALGISTPTADSIPPLTPPVPRVHDVELPETFGSAWDRWWAQSLVTGGAEDVPGRWPVGLPEHLRDAYGQWQPDRSSPEVTWQRDDAMAAFSASLNEVVDQLTEELGHAPLFELDVIEIPVQGQFWRRLGKNTVLVSEELKASRNVIAPLESVIRDLVE